ncbi:MULTISPECIES: histidinol-phosphate transaminase [Psychrobacter]|uniref:Histidinol-phosphate aminotransferase n=2 Tax=Psychrobacter TaxID=497 RepID=A0A844M425_9GAMM|nr:MULTISPECIES: histidinol-phosphate transaminase [Psychrobacter]MUG33297.1 histidinol-phosphate transaminase [Psychrobacter sanguinis]
MSQKTFATPAYASIATLSAYQSSRSVEELKREYEVNDVLKLASNENPLGCSPYVTLAITEQLGQLARYPDGKGHDLKQAIAYFNEVHSKQVTLGNGSNDLLDLIARTFVGHEDAIIYSEYAFIVYAMLAKILGAKGVEVPAKRYGHDLPAMLDAVQHTPNARLVFIANPNNPTGTLLSSEEIRDFVAQVPSHVLVVLDEAYVEYSPESNNRALLEDFDNVIIVRTFSKAYGLAGLRVGYALSHPEVATMLDRVRQPFNVSLVAQSAAVAALGDQDFIAKVHKINDGQMRWICKQFDALGLGFVKSYANFVMVNVGDAQSINQALLEQGVIVYPLTAYGLPEWLRITVGTPEDNTRLIDTLRDTLQSL